MPVSPAVLRALCPPPPGLGPTSAIHVYTPREVYGTVGSHVTLSCSFWSSEWISEDISITWHFQAEGSRDSISVSTRTGRGLRGGSPLRPEPPRDPLRVSSPPPDISLRQGAALHR